MHSSNPTFFNNPDVRKIHDEQLCLLLGFMLNQQQYPEPNPADDQIKEAVEKEFSCHFLSTVKVHEAEIFADYDKLLMFRSHNDAIDFARRILNIEDLKELKTRDFLNTFYQITPILHTQNATQDDWDCMSFILTVCALNRAWWTFKDIFVRLPENAFSQCIDSCSWFMRAVHFGDADMFDWLLEHGLNANEVNTKDFLGKYRPLHYILRDVSNCLSRMKPMVEAAHNGNHEYGSVEVLQAYFSKRIQAFKQMLMSLLAHGANPDIQAEPGFVYKITPRELAISLQTEMQGKLETIPDHARFLVTGVLEVMDNFINSQCLDNVVREQPRLC